MLLVLKLILTGILMFTSLHSAAQSLALDKRLQDRKETLATYQSELARAKATAEARPSALELQFAYAQALEKVWKYTVDDDKQTHFSPFENAIRAVNSLTEGQLNSGPKIIETAAYRAALKLYEDSELMRSYWVTGLPKRDNLTSYAERESYASNALKIYRNLVKNDPKNIQWQAAYVNATVRTLTGQRQSVHDNFQSTLSLILRLVKENPKSIQLQRALAATYAAKGLLLVPSTSDNGFVDEWKKEIDIRVAVLNQAETNAHRAELAAALERNATYFATMGGGERAFFALTDAKKLVETLIENEPGNVHHTFDLLRINRALAEVRSNYDNKLKKAQATYLSAIESSMRAANENPRNIEKVLANAFKNHEETVELIYLNTLKLSIQLVEKQPSTLQAQLALVTSYIDLGKFYASELDNNPQAIKTYTEGAQRLSDLAAQNPNDIAWLFYQLELNIALGFAYAREIRDAQNEKQNELLTPIPGDELKAAKDIRYIAKSGNALKDIEIAPAHRRYAAAIKTSEETYAKVIKLVDVALSKTPQIAVDPKKSSSIPKRREF
jgi:hypothetical protein